MVNPLQQVFLMYQSQGVGEYFWSDLLECRATGLVVATDSECLMVSRYRDGWYLNGAVGRESVFKKWIQMMPYYLPYVYWRRVCRGDWKFRRMRTERLMKRYGKGMRIL